MTVFLMFSIIGSICMIINSIHHEVWYGPKRVKIYLIIGLYACISSIRFIILDDYVNLEEYMLLLLLCVLTVQLIFDLNAQMIDLQILITILPIVFIYRLISYSDFKWIDVVAIISVGAFAWIVKRFLSKSIGLGDIIMCELFVCWIGIQLALLLLMTAFVLNGIICMLLFVTKRVHKHSQLPFMPALILSLVLYLFGGGMVW